MHLLGHHNENIFKNNNTTTSKTSCENTGFVGSLVEDLQALKVYWSFFLPTLFISLFLLSPSSPLSFIEPHFKAISLPRILQVAVVDWMRVSFIASSTWVLGSSWWNCWGRISTCDLVRGGLSLEWRQTLRFYAIPSAFSPSWLWNTMWVFSSSFTPPSQTLIL